MGADNTVDERLSERAPKPAKAADVAGTSDWWHRYDDIVPAWMHYHLGLEQAASLIRTYELQVIPALLQTEEYARAVIALAHQGDSADQIERRVELQIERKRILHRANPARLWAVIDEAALRHSIGGPAIMRAQLEHLIDIAALSNVAVQVLPLEAGGHAAVGGPVTLLRVPEWDLPDVVYLEQLRSASYPDNPDEIEYYRQVMDQLVTLAHPRIATTGIVDRIIKDS